ncbi:Lectin-like protein BA14k [Nitratireductor aquimarinus]|uniref:BA14K family protein n=1 Tax=Nitratireductor aquimarinus TaxID=889300 RepID=UPI003B59E9BF
MKRNLVNIACSGLLALGFAVIGAPANANALGIAGSATTNAVERSATQAPFVQVDRRERRNWRRHNDRRKWRHRHNRRDWHRRGPSAGFYFEFGRPAPYYYRPRYVRPPQYRRPVRLSRAHVNWCYDRYRSYRASDNTFQPYHGPRKRCISPYYR